MGVTDWEPRALPSEARCQRWYEQGGRLLVSWTSGVVTTLEPVDGAFCAPSNIVHVRPWKDNNPATWSDFFTATHPPIPDGWVNVGEWYACGVTGEKPQINDGVYTSGDGYAVPLRRALPAIPAGWEQLDKWKHRDAIVVLLNEGERLLMQDGQITQGGSVSGWCTVVRRLPPPADWGDVPKGVDLRPNLGRGGARNDVILNGVYVGRVFDKTDEGYFTHGTDQMPVAGSPFPSLPAAIVALTGRRDE